MGLIDSVSDTVSRALNCCRGKRDDTQQLEKPLLANTSKTATSEIGTIIKDDLYAYYKDPVRKVLNDPIKALVYSTAAKIVALFISLVFPFLGYTLLGCSLALIDRVIVVKSAEFRTSLTKMLPGWMQSIVNSFFGAPQGTAPAA